MIATHNTIQVPTHPHPSCDPITFFEPSFQRLVAALQALFDERPIWTRRALVNNVRDLYAQAGDNAKRSIQYVAYNFRSGAWKDTFIKFGVDPRSDPKYRWYQTLTYQLRDMEDKRTDSARPLKGKTHIFDGNTFEMDGRVWQICDITDPLSKSIFAIDKINETCAARTDGWWPNGTLAKAKVVIKAKFIKLLNGETPKDTDFNRVINFPDFLTPENRKVAVIGKEATPEEASWAAEFRSLAMGTAAKQADRRREKEKRQRQGDDNAADGRNSKTPIDEESSGLDAEMDGEEDEDEDEEMGEAGGGDGEDVQSPMVADEDEGEDEDEESSGEEPDL